MNVLSVLSGLLLSMTLAAGPAAAQAGADSGADYRPVPYQEGRDVVWVPTQEVLIEKMLDMAALSPADIVVDLGSGDGRNVIAAARRGAKAHGIEFNPDLVALARRNAVAAGLADQATFSEGDMFEADLSQATVLPLFLIDENLNALVPKFLQMRPGARIVNNSFKIDGWEPDETGTAERDCTRYCTAYLYIVPARAAGVWRIGGDELVLEQKFQTLNGTLTTGDGKRLPVEAGRLRGEMIAFRAGGADYTGRVTGDAIVGTKTGDAGGPWSAVRTTAGGR